MKKRELKTHISTYAMRPSTRNMLEQMADIHEMSIASTIEVIIRAEAKRIGIEPIYTQVDACDTGC